MPWAHPCPPPPMVILMARAMVEHAPWTRGGAYAASGLILQGGGCRRVLDLRLCDRGVSRWGRRKEVSRLALRHALSASRPAGYLSPFASQASNRIFAGHGTYGVDGPPFDGSSAGLPSEWERNAGGVRGASVAGGGRGDSVAHAANRRHGDSLRVADRGW